MKIRAISKEKMRVISGNREKMERMQSPTIVAI